MLTHLKEICSSQSHISLIISTSLHIVFLLTSSFIIIIMAIISIIITNMEIIVLMMMILSAYLIGISNCTWSSCRHGCTAEVYKCWQVQVSNISYNRDYFFTLILKKSDSRFEV